MKTRISVIIPVYNVYEFLEECVDSVLAQTINNMELTDGYERNLQIILVDDGSTDNSPIMAKQYADDFENVEYVHEENQGLGHARNYGCEFAEGDYIIFLDSDDIVPPNAYEWMYKAAIKNGSDMTIGAVWRFNSSRCMSSNIHEKAFNGTKEVTHITESPELFYDTTAWNKLIKHSFWNEHKFQFPEGILYEDIPVTMPMHFLANNVSIVYENCYLWRIREGKSKSITQTTEESKTLNDRLLVMSMVDEFYDENVKDKNLHDVKNLKWLKNDLMIFIHKLKSVDKKDADEIMTRVRDYILNNIDFEYYIDDLNEFERLRYEYLLDGDFDKLVELLNFETYQLKVTKVYQKNAHVMFDADEKLFKKTPFTIDKYIHECVNMKYIQNVDFKNDSIEIKGFTVIPGIDVKNFSDRTYEFSLINSNTHKNISLNHEDVKLDNLSSFDIRFGRDFSYPAAGYKLNIPLDLFIGNDFDGENRILVSFTQKDINYNFFAGSARMDVRAKSNMKALIYKDKYLRFKYTPKDEIIIEVIPIDYCYEKITLENEYFCIHSPQSNGDLFLYYEADSLNTEQRIPLTYDNESKMYKIKLNTILTIPGKIINDDDEQVIYKSKELLPLYSKYGHCIVSAVNDYFMDICKYDNVTEVSEIEYNNGVFKIKANLHALYENDFKSATLYFKDKFNQENNLLSKGIIKDDYIEFKLDLSNKNVTKNLYQDVHELFVEYEYGNKIFSTPLHCLNDFNQEYSKKLYDYNVYRGLNGTLEINVTQNWSIYENTPGKRLKHSNLTYKFFLKLPINKKRVMFESMWGSKYSCNPRYLYEYINENYPEYDCVWSVYDEHFPIKGKGKRVRKASLKYLYYLATSKFFVNNVNFHDHYIKRPGQLEIQTMHGTPLKTLGLDVPGDFPTKKSEEKYINKCNRWDYLTVQSDFVSNIAESCFKFTKKFLKYGYPRTDILYSKNNETDIIELKKKMNLPLDKKVILYAPTWRLMDKFDLKIDLESFKKSLSKDYILILRLHHFSVKGWKQLLKDDFIYDLSDYGSVEELYLVSDVLITDYSSVMFDYAILDRPMILYTYDLDEYRDKLRGLYVDIEDNAPGPILFTSKEVENAILNLKQTEDETSILRKKFQEKFIQYECEDSSKKIFNEVMSGNSNENILNKLIRKIMPLIKRFEL